LIAAVSSGTEDEKEDEAPKSKYESALLLLK
jgi:hypothetical protein